MRLAAALLAAVLSGCSVFTHDPIPDLGQPDERLEATLTELRDAHEKEAGEMDEQDPRYRETRASDAVLRDLETLAFDFPDHAGIRYACGAAAYQAERREHARVHLDAALDADPRLVAATALRARMAVEDGNYPRAGRLVDDGLLLAPDDVDLLLLRAQLRHLDGDANAALADLNTAEALGVDAWRVDYHRALVHEGLGSAAEAERFLRRCLAAKDDFAPARARLNRIEAR